MRYWYPDCLNLIHQQVGTETFTLAQVRPALEEALPEGCVVNGSVMKEFCADKFLVQLDGDLHLKGSHFVHRYQLTPKGQQYLMRRMGAVAVAAAC